MAVTLKDIAKKAGVTTATVSMVINNKPNISETTKKRVLAIAKELNYYPNSLGRALATKRSNAIGIIIPSLSSSFIIRIMEGIKSSLRNANYTLVLFDIMGARQNELELYKRVIYEGRVDGVIIITSNASSAELKLFTDEKIPAVVVAKKIEDITSVYVDNKQGSFEAVKYLLENGHKKIGLVTVNKPNVDFLERTEGYKKALKEYNIEFSQDLVYEVTDDSIKDGSYIAKRLVNQEDRPTAFFCVSGDMTAIGMIKEFRRSGVRVPEDASIIGYDDVPAAEVVEPALTTVRQPKLEMGDYAINTIIDKIEALSSTSTHTTPSAPLKLSAKFIIRESA